MRQTIYTERYHFLLGIGAVSELFRVLKDGSESEISSHGIVDDIFIGKLKTMEVGEFGFTEEYKTKMLSHFEGEKGKHYLITDDWWPDDDRKKQVKFFMKCFDETNDFESAKEKTNTHFFPESKS